jgi:hypothetical protein
MTELEKQNTACSEQRAMRIAAGTLGNKKWSMASLALQDGWRSAEVLMGYHQSIQKTRLYELLISNISNRSGLL